MKIHKIAFVLLIIGGLNWLLEAFGYGIGNYIPESIAMVVYILVGVSAIYEIVTHKSNCKHCDVRSMPNQSAPSSMSSM
jgi:uncharacterized membrane protein YuzA (DUF378 family)